MDGITTIKEQRFLVVRKAEDQVRTKTYLVKEEELYRAHLVSSGDGLRNSQRPLSDPETPAEEEVMDGVPLDQPQHGADEALPGPGGVQSQDVWERGEGG